jgi:hypothetical protein
LNFNGRWISPFLVVEVFPWRLAKWRSGRYHSCKVFSLKHLAVCEGCATVFLVGMVADSI